MASAAMRAAPAAEAVAPGRVAGGPPIGRAALGLLATVLATPACLTAPGPAAPVDASADCLMSTLFASSFDATLDPAVWYWCDDCTGGATVAVDPDFAVLKMDLQAADALGFAGLNESFPLTSRLRIAVSEVEASGPTVAQLNVGWNDEHVISVSREAEGDLVVWIAPARIELWRATPAPHRALVVDGDVVTLEQSANGVDWTRDVIVGALDGVAPTEVVDVQLLAIGKDVGSVSFDDLTVAACSPQAVGGTSASP